MPSQPVERQRSTLMTFVAGLAWCGFKLGFGLTSLASVWASAALKDGTLWANDTKEEKQELAAAQEKYWSLDRQPLPGFRHAFFTTGAGTRLHFVTNANAGSSDAKNVCLFIHGFPDSFLLWRHILQSAELQRNHILIAVDLPGYGGSDGLPSYGAYDMLEAMTEFILDMRKQYLQADRKLVIATHDWGALIGARLASEASQLADRWIITSGMLPHLTASNAKSQMSLAKQMLRTWSRSPFNFRLLKNAYAALGPIRSQFRRSFYIFCFQLPWPFSNFFATFGNYWFLRVLQSLGKGSPRKGEPTFRLNSVEAGEAMATSTGPGMPQLDSATENTALRYGEAIRKRCHDRGMYEKIRIYREGLFVGKWEKSLEITAALYDISTSANGSSAQPSSSGSLLSTAPRGALKAATTFLLGERDPAFDRQLALNNAKDFLVPGSHVALVKEAGHWLPLEPAGRRVLEKVVVWALSEKNGGKEHGDISGPFETMSEVKVVVEL